MSGNFAFEGSYTTPVNVRINNAAASGDTTVVAATAGKTVRVYGLRLSAAAAVTVQIKDGAGTVLEVINLGAGVPFVLNIKGFPHYTLTQGNALVINASTTVQVDGLALYSNMNA